MSGLIALLDDVAAIAKVAAASVDETMAPSSSPSRNENPCSHDTNSPTRTAVTTTPMVDNASPFHNTGRMPFHSA